MLTRLATHTDANSINTLLAEMRQKPVDNSLTQLQLDKFIGNNERAIILIETDDGEICGMGAVNLVYKLPKVEARIDEVVVSSAHRGQGYAQELMNQMESWAWQQKADVIELTSRPSREAANRLYQKIGYGIRETNVYQKKRQD